MAITLSLDDYFIASYTKPATFDTISTYVVNATKGSQTEIKTALWALSTVIFVIVILIVVGMNMTSKAKARVGKEVADMSKRSYSKDLPASVPDLCMLTPAAYLVHVEADDKTQDQAEASAHR